MLIFFILLFVMSLVFTLGKEVTGIIILSLFGLAFVGTLLVILISIGYQNY
jgi:hypothetical protein